MRRRELITAIGGAAAFLSRLKRAQPAEIPTIGALGVGAPNSDKFWRLFQNGMRGLDYVEGQNIRYEVRSDQGQSGALPGLAAELVRRNVDVIVAWFTPAATAAQQATHDIPIVMTAGDPIATGLVASLAHPGGNITGISRMTADLAGKCIDLLREMLPAAHRWSMRPTPFPSPSSKNSNSRGRLPESRSIR